METMSVESYFMKHVQQIIEDKTIDDSIKVASIELLLNLALHHPDKYVQSGVIAQHAKDIVAAALLVFGKGHLVNGLGEGVNPILRFLGVISMANMPKGGTWPC